MYAFRKSDGAPIVCSIEKVECVCGIIDDSFEWDPDNGDLIFAYDGTGAKIDWDEQFQLRNSWHKQLFLTEGGDRVPSTQIELVEEPRTAERVKSQEILVTLRDDADLALFIEDNRDAIEKVGPFVNTLKNSGRDVLMGGGAAPTVRIRWLPSSG